MESLVDAGGPNEHKRVVRTGPEDPGLGVYPSLGRCWLMVLISAGMAALPLWVAAGGDPAHMPPDPLDRLWPLGAGLFCVACGLFPLTMLLRREPAVIAEQSGISVVFGWRVVSFVPWSEVVGFSSYSRTVSGGTRQHFVRASLSDSAAALPGISRAQRRHQRIDIPTMLLPLKAEELAAELNALHDHYRKQARALPLSDRGDQPASGVITVEANYPRPTELPARPDRHTGKPRPPHAPAYKGHPSQNGPDPARKPSPPQGEGPIQAWYPGTSTTLTAVTGVVWCVILGGILVLCNGHLPLVVWAYIGLASFGLAWSSRTGACTAGSDWVARNRRWVRTYELIEITYRARFGPRLRLQDSAGRTATIKIESLQGDREIWDLVYNGILHSVIAGGARTDRLLHLVLHLPYPDPDISRGERH